MSFTYIRSKRYLFNKPTVSCSSKIACRQQDRNLVPKLTTRIYLRRRCGYSSNVRSLASSFFRVASPVACYYGLKSVNPHRLFGLARRFYSTNNYQQESLTRVVFDVFRSLPLSIQFCILVTIFFGSFQLVPVSNGFHLTVSPDRFENLLGTVHWENEARKSAGAILSPSSPESIRVHRILKQILRATHDHLGLKNDYQVSVYVPNQDIMRISTEGAAYARRRKDREHYWSTSKESKLRKFFRRLGEISEDLSEAAGFNTRVKVRELFHSNTKTVRVKPRRVKKLGLLKYGTEHLDGLNWELMVVDSYQENAGYLPNGKIIFYTGWFKRYKSSEFTDEDIATILAHEVGHGLARHPSENLIRGLWLLALIVLPLSKIPNANPRAVQGIAGAIVALFSRTMEVEADSIGMMLMASAGYDPRHAPEFHKKHGGIENYDFLRATHPDGEKRAQKLNRPQEMGKALDVFNQVQSGQEIKTFI